MEGLIQLKNVYATPSKSASLKISLSVSPLSKTPATCPLNDADYIPIREKIQFLLEATKLVNGDLRTRLVLKVEALIDGRELDDFDDSPAADFVTDFIDRHCVRDKNASVSSPQLIRLISERCPEAENTSRKAISKMLRNIDRLKEVKNHGTIHIKGIRLIEGIDD